MLKYPKYHRKRFEERFIIDLKKVCSYVSEQSKILNKVIYISQICLGFR